MRITIGKILAGVLAVMLVLGHVGAFAASGNLAINAKNFPDAAFRQYVKDEFDANSDDKLSKKEISKATSIWLDQSEYKVKSMSGIAKLTALQEIEITNSAGGFGSLKSLNLKKNTKLKSLCLSRVSLSKLDLSKNTKLVSLELNQALIIKLNLSKNKQLTELYISACRQLKSLDLSKNTRLIEVEVAWNALNTLKLGKLKKLVTLSCHGNNLAKVNLSGCTKLLNVARSKTAALDGTFYEWDSDPVYMMIDSKTQLFNGSKAIAIQVETA